jgi:nucleoside-diphosphate-sugar epimerase
MGSDLVLVTGASGYVAGHCILRLLDGGYKGVTGIDPPSRLSQPLPDLACSLQGPQGPAHARPSRLVNSRIPRDRCQ